MLDEDLSKNKDLEKYIADFEQFVPVAFCLLNQGNIITEVNSEFESVTNADSADLRGADFSSLFKESNVADHLLDNVGDSFNTTQVRTLTLRNDTPVKVTATTRKNRDGVYEGHFIALESIEKTGAPPPAQSSAHNTEDLLDKVKEEQMRTQSIIYNLFDGIIFLDADGCIDIVNPRFGQLFNVDQSNLIGRKLGDVDIAIVEKTAKKLANGDEIEQEEISGETNLSVEVTAVSVGGNDTESERQLLIFHDITEEKQIEKMKLEFASVAAHQMRTPLSSIRWSFEIISKQTDEEDTKEVAQRGYRSTRQVLEVVNELLNVDRLEAGRSAYEFAPVDITDLLADCLEDERAVGEVVEKPNINYHPPEDHVPQIRGDAQKLKIVFKNLIDNALKYTDPDDEIEIRVTLDMSSGYAGDKVEVSVKDEGIGIPESAREQIFSKFFRADNATAKKTEGTGVGLFITKRIVEAHNGEIWFESEAGEGTTFFVQLPIANRQA